MAIIFFFFFHISFVVCTDFNQYYSLGLLKDFERTGAAAAFGFGAPNEFLPSPIDSAKTNAPKQYENSSSETSNISKKPSSNYLFGFHPLLSGVVLPKTETETIFIVDTMHRDSIEFYFLKITQVQIEWPYRRHAHRHHRSEPVAECPMISSQIYRIVEMHAIVYSAKPVDSNQPIQMTIFLQLHQMLRQRTHRTSAAIPYRAAVFRPLINSNACWTDGNVAKSDPFRTNKKTKNILNGGNETMRRPKNREMHEKYEKIGLVFRVDSMSFWWFESHMIM